MSFVLSIKDFILRLVAWERNKHEVSAFFPLLEHTKQGDASHGKLRAILPTLAKEPLLVLAGEHIGCCGACRRVQRWPSTTEGQVCVTCGALVAGDAIYRLNPALRQKGRPLAYAQAWTRDPAVATLEKLQEQERVTQIYAKQEITLRSELAEARCRIQELEGALTHAADRHRGVPDLSPA